MNFSHKKLQIDVINFVSIIQTLFERQPYEKTLSPQLENMNIKRMNPVPGAALVW